jgi:hypothetical protein
MTRTYRAGSPSLRIGKHIGAMGAQASYLVQGGPIPDQFDLVPEPSDGREASRSMPLATGRRLMPMSMRRWPP